MMQQARLERGNRILAETDDENFAGRVGRGIDDFGRHSGISVAGQFPDGVGRAGGKQERGEKNCFLIQHICEMLYS